MRHALFLILFAGLAFAQPLLQPEGNYTLPGNVSSIAMSADARYLVAGSDSGRAVFLGAGGEPLWSRDYEEGVAAVAISRDGDYALVAHGSTITVLDRQGEVMLNGSLGSNVRALARSGTRTAIATEREVLFVENETMAWNYSVGVPIHALAVYAGVSRGVFGSSDEFIFHWSSDGLLTRKINLGGTIYSLAAGSDGSLIAAGGADKRVYLIDREGKLKWKYDVPDEVRAVAMTPDGKYVLAGTAGGDAFLLGSEGGLALRYDAGGRIAGVALSDDGRYFALAHGGKVDFFDGEGYFRARLEHTLELLDGANASGAELSMAEALYAAANSAMRENDYAGAMASAEAAERALATAVSKVRSRSEMEISGAERALGATRAEGLGFLVSGQLSAAQERVERAKGLAGEGRYADAAREARGAGDDAVAAGNTAKMYVVGASGLIALFFLIVIAWRIPALIAFFSPTNVRQLVEQALILRDAGHVRAKADTLRKHLAAGKELEVPVAAEEAKLSEILGRLSEGERLVRARKLNEGQELIRHAKKELDALLEEFKEKLEKRKAEYEKGEHEIMERAEEFVKEHPPPSEGQPPPGEQPPTGQPPPPRQPDP